MRHPPFSSLRILIIVIVLSAACAANAAEPVEPEAPAPKPENQFDNPVRKISDLMTKAGKLLETLETGEPTQEEQKKILAELDRLIEMAEKSSSSSSSRQQQQQQQQQQMPQQPKNAGAGGGSRPAQDETDNLRPTTGRPGSGAPDLREIWGTLPQKTRDDVDQLLQEKIPAKYKKLIDRYFRALSEEK